MSIFTKEADLTTEADFILVFNIAKVKKKTLYRGGVN